MHATTPVVLLALGGIAASAPQSDASSDASSKLMGEIPGHMFHSDPLGIAKQVAPAWQMDEDMCMPTRAVQKDGSQTKGIAAAGCIEDKQNDGCEAPKRNKPDNADPNPFPTYWTLRYCEGDKSWRVLFDVFFQKDAGHTYDWEWAVVKFAQSAGKKDTWHRDGVWFQQDTHTPFKQWPDVRNTFTSDINLYGKTGGLRPHLYFGKWHHPVFDTPQTSIFSDTCPPTSADDYRSTDFRFDSTKWLLPGSSVPTKFNWGSDADSFPASFEKGAKHDICKLSTG